MKKLFFALSFFLQLSLTFSQLQNKQILNKQILEISEETEHKNILEDTPEDQAKQKKNIIFKIADFIKTAPYTLDVGCEPSLNGSTSFFSFEYFWSNIVSSQILFEYTSQVEFENESNFMYKSDYTINSNYIRTKIFPYKRLMFLKILESHIISANLGLYSLYQTSTTAGLRRSISQDSNVPLTHFVIAEDKTSVKAFLIGPCIQINYRLPIKSWISIGSELSVTPFSFFYTDTKYSYSKINMYKIPDASISTRTINMGSIDARVHLDFFGITALVARYQYERLNLNDITYAYEKLNLAASEYTYSSHTIQAGISTIKTGKGFVRLRAGIYREFKWETNFSTKETNFSKNWRLSISAGF